MVANFALSYNRKILRGAITAIEAFTYIHLYHCDHLQSELVFKSRRPKFDAVLLGACLPSLRLPVKFKGCRLPTVDTSGEIFPPPLPRVITDDVLVGRHAAEYFLHRGFNRYLYFGYKHFHWSNLRLQGFRDALSSRGKSVAEITYDDSTSWDLAAAADALTSRLVGEGGAPMAIFCANDTIAASVIESCQHAGVPVPEQAAVLGVDDDQMYTQMRRPHISSMQLQDERIGYKAMRLLLTLLERRAGVSSRRVPQILIPPHLIISRQSTDTVAADDPLVRRATSYIRDHLHEGVNIKQLMHALNTSRTTLETRFKRSIGRRPGEEMRRQRMTRACDLLASTQSSVGEIARRVGFSSAQLFSESFRRHHKMTPLAYRDAHRRVRFG